MIKSIIKKFIKHKFGVALLEFALILPTLILIAFGSIEISNLVFTSQKNQTVAIVASNLVAALDNLSTEEIQNIGRLGERMVENFINEGDYGMVITMVQMTNNSTNSSGKHFPFIVYQGTYGKTNLVKSRFNYNATGGGVVNEGYANSNKIQPADINNYTFIGTEQIIIAETAVRYKTILSSSTTNGVVEDLMTVKFETPPAIPRINRFRFLPGNILIP